MALVPCPACGLPRAAADATTACPACRWAEPAPPPPPPAPEPPPPPAPEPAPPRTYPLVAGVVGVAAGVLATLAVQFALRSEPEPEPTPVPEVTAVGPPVYLRVPSLPVAPPPRLVEPAGPIVLPVPVPFPVDGGFAALKVDQPDELYHFPKLGPGNRVRLTGRVKKLTVDGLEAGAELDASGLATDGVSVAEAVEGGVLRVAADGGTVTFRRGIRGGAVVEVAAPKSYVSFAPLTGAKVGPSVGGGARVTMQAKSVEVGGPVAGAGTLLDVTFSRGGSLKLAAVEGGAQVRYRPGHRADPPVRVTPPGIVTAAGPVREDEPPP